MGTKESNKGVRYALLIHLLWWACLIYAMTIEFDWSNPLVYLLVLIQTHLYTGLFGTAHDAMHSTVSHNKSINKGIGTVSAILFSYNFYGKLNKKHHLHHRFVATDKDPDYHRGNAGFWSWYLSFVTQYVSIWQILLMRPSLITFHKLWLPDQNLIFLDDACYFIHFPVVLFWHILPHKGNHSPQNDQKSRSQSFNHLKVSFLTCYFLGIIKEHHDIFPHTLVAIV